MDYEVIQDMEPCWPFWGLLVAFEHPPDSKGNAHYCIVMRPISQSDIFQRFDFVYRQSLEMLKQRKIGELRAAAMEIQAEIENSIDYYIEVETERLVRDLCENSGYQLDYLPNDSRGTEYQIRYLLSNWSSEWDDPSGLPQREEMSDLVALSEYLDGNKYDEKIGVHLGLVEPSEHEFYAVLALMIICESVHSNPLNSRHPESFSRMKEIGIATINAMEVIAYAEQIRFEIKIRKAIASEQPAILAAEIETWSKNRETQAKQRLSVAGAKGGENKNALSNELKNWALKEGKNLKGHPADKARKLMNRLPSDIDEKIKKAGDKFKDPERVIREALAKQRNESSTASQPHVTDD